METRGRILCGEDLISTRYKSCMKELPEIGTKDFFPNGSWLEGEQICTALEERRDLLSDERVERISSMSSAEWLAEEKRAKVTKKVGKMWERFGHHVDDDDWLMPEEALFLLETNSLELMFGGVHLSIERFYYILLSSDINYSLPEYQVYSHLCRLGYRLVRHSPQVTVTRYEKSIRLDKIVEAERQSPPLQSTTSSVLEKPSNCSVQIQPVLSVSGDEDGDVFIVEDEEDCSMSQEQKEESTLPLMEVEDNDVILVEDEEGPSNGFQKEELISCSSSSSVSSESSSDVICILGKTRRVNLWSVYLSQDTFLAPNASGDESSSDEGGNEGIIDLCEDDSNSLPSTVTKKSDGKPLEFIPLETKTREQILDLLPSAKNGVTHLKRPDPKFMPPNICPRYDEYRVNLNVKPQQFSVKYDGEGCYRGGGSGVESGGRSIRPLLTPSIFHNSNSGSTYFRRNSFFSPMQNPLFRQAQEMQAMAIGMMHTATRLLSLQSVSPPHQPMLSVANFQSPPPQRHQWVPWRPRHFPRFQHPRRHWENGFGRPSSLKPPKPSSAFKRSPEIIFLDSDNEEPEEKKSKIKRRLSPIEEEATFSYKRIKQETDDVIILEPVNPELVPNGDILEMKPDIELIEVKPKDLGLKSEDLEVVDLAAPEGEVIDLVTARRVSKTTVEVINIETLQDDATKIVDLIGTSGNDAADISDVDMKKAVVVHEVIDVDEKQVSECEAKIDIVMTGGDIEDDLCAIKETISNWSQFKLNFQLESQQTEEVVKASVIEPILKPKDCTTIGNILSRLQIFGCIESSAETKDLDDQSDGVGDGLKISYDVYLPNIHFKKSLKMLPNFRIIIVGHECEVPSESEMRRLHHRYDDDIPNLFANVTEDSINFFVYDSIHLPILTKGRPMEPKIWYLEMEDAEEWKHRLKADYAQSDILSDEGEEVADQEWDVLRVINEFAANIRRPSLAKDDADVESPHPSEVVSGSLETESDRMARHPLIGDLEEHMPVPLAESTLQEHPKSASDHGPGTSAGSTTVTSSKMPDSEPGRASPLPGHSQRPDTSGTEEEPDMDRTHVTFNLVTETRKSPFRLKSSSSSGVAVSELLRPMRGGPRSRGTDRARVASWVRTGLTRLPEESIELQPTLGRRQFSDETIVRMEESTTSGEDTDDERMSTSDEEETRLLPPSRKWSPRRRI